MTNTHSIKPWIGICLVIATLGLATYLVMFRGPADLASEAEEIANRAADNAMDKAERAGGWLKRAAESLGLSSTIIVNNEVIDEGTKTINELSTAEKTFKQKFDWEHTYLGSTKQIEVQAIFTAKAGYKLDRLPQLEINAEGNRVIARLPDPVILSNEQRDFRIINDKNGIWNRLSKEDREHAQNELKRRADETAGQSDLLKRADEYLIEHLRKSVEDSSNAKVEVVREPLDTTPLVDQD